jgi:hypothetical protein
LSRVICVIAVMMLHGLAVAGERNTVDVVAARRKAHQTLGIGWDPDEFKTKQIHVRCGGGVTVVVSPDSSLCAVGQVGRLALFDSELNLLWSRDDVLQSTTRLSSAGITSVFSGSPAKIPPGRHGLRLEFINRSGHVIGQRTWPWPPSRPVQRSPLREAYAFTPHGGFLLTLNEQLAEEESAVCTNTRLEYLNLDGELLWDLHLGDGEARFLFRRDGTAVAILVSDGSLFSVTRDEDAEVLVVSWAGEILSRSRFPTREWYEAALALPNDDELLYSHDGRLYSVSISRGTYQSEPVETDFSVLYGMILDCPLERVTSYSRLLCRCLPPHLSDPELEIMNEFLSALPGAGSRLDHFIECLKRRSGGAYGE